MTIYLDNPDVNYYLAPLRDDGDGLIGKPNQWYGWGSFELGTDEALVVEFDVPPDARCWCLHLGDALTFTLDWANRPTSINGFTAHIDDDGLAPVPPPRRPAAQALVTSEDVRCPGRYHPRACPRAGGSACTC